MPQVITYSRFWMRRDTALAWAAANPILHEGEIGIEQDPGASPGEARMKIGDGLTAWNSLGYFGEPPGGSGITELTGDVTATGPGSVVATLATLQGGAHTWTAAQTHELSGSDTLRLVDADDDGSIALGFWSSNGFQSASGRGWRIESTATNAAIGTLTIQNWNGTAYALAFSLTPTSLAINGNTVLTSATGQPLDATLTALAGNNWAANAFPIGSGADTVAQVAFAANTFPARASTGNLVAKTISDDALAFVAAANNGAMRTALGGTTVGQAIFTLTNPGAVNFLRINADNTVTARSAANFLTDLGVSADAQLLLGDSDVVRLSTVNVFTATNDFNVGGTAPAANTSTVVRVVRATAAGSQATFAVISGNTATVCGYHMGDTDDEDAAGVLYNNSTETLGFRVAATANVLSLNTTALTNTVGEVNTSILSPPQITANTDNYQPTGHAVARFFRLSTDAARNLTGLGGGVSGRIATFSNVGAQNLVLVHDATSTAANRFLCPGSANFTLNANDSVNLWYDGTSSRWRVIAY